MLPFYWRFITSIGPWTLMRLQEWSAQCPLPSPRALSIRAAATAGERDGPVAPPTTSIVCVFRIQRNRHISPAPAFHSFHPSAPIIRFFSANCSCRRALSRARYS